MRTRGSFYWLAASSVLAVLVWLADFATPNELSLFIFQLVPIYLVAWNVSRRTAIIFALVSAVAWLLNEEFMVNRFYDRIVLAAAVLLKSALFFACAYLVSTLRLVQDSLSSQNQELAVANEMKSRFLAMAAHDLRTPLNSIMMMSELALVHARGKSDGSAMDAESVGRILDAGARMRMMLDNYLDLSRIEAGELSPRIRSENLTQWLTTVCDSIRPLAEGRSIRLIVESEAPDRAYDFDPELLETAVMNLLSNAFKYAPSGTAVVVRCRAPERGFVIEVEDQGPGLGADPEALFDLFRLGDTPTQSHQKSSGLGLFIARRAVSLHHGTLAGMNSPRGGALLRLHVPAQPDVSMPSQ